MIILCSISVLSLILGIIIFLKNWNNTAAFLVTFLGIAIGFICPLLFDIFSPINVVAEVTYNLETFDTKDQDYIVYYENKCMVKYKDETGVTIIKKINEKSINENADSATITIKEREYRNKIIQFLMKGFSPAEQCIVNLPQGYDIKFIHGVIIT